MSKLPNEYKLSYRMFENPPTPIDKYFGNFITMGAKFWGAPPWWTQANKTLVEERLVVLAKFPAFPREMRISKVEWVSKLNNEKESALNLKTQKYRRRKFEGWIKNEIHYCYFLVWLLKQFCLTVFRLSSTSVWRLFEGKIDNYAVQVLNLETVLNPGRCLLGWCLIWGRCLLGMVLNLGAVLTGVVLNLGWCLIGGGFQTNKYGTVDFRWFACQFGDYSRNRIE